MHFKVDHLTRYQYTQPVYFEPHVIRLRPRSDSFQRLVRYQLKIKPQPSVLSEFLDAEGNSVAQVWFSGLSDVLELVVSFQAETLRTNPFDYLLLGAEHVPLEYPKDVQPLLAACLEGRPDPASPVAKFSESVAIGVNRQLLPFLQELNRQLYQNFNAEIREIGAPETAEETLRQRRGACRDLTVLFIDCCRAQGIAARFVSGYRTGERDCRYMHAWAEVYIPGGGWRGYDPTHGLTVADQHVAVAASARPAMAAPTYGTFRGTGVTSKMLTELTIRVTAT